MNRDQIIETMAMSLAVGRGRIAAGPGEIKEAERALTAVLPMIRAEVLEEAAKVAMNRDVGNGYYIEIREAIAEAILSLKGDAT